MTRPGRPDVDIVSQLGVESVHGTAVPASRFLPTISLMPKLKRETKQFRAQGRKYTTSSVRHKQHAEGTYDGVLDYNSILYVLSGLTVPASPAAVAGSTSARLWSYRPLTRHQDDPLTYTIEVGDETAVDRFDYCQFSSMNVALGQDDAKISGNLIARTMTPNLTQTDLLNEIQTLHITATGGTFTITNFGGPSPAIPFDVTLDDFRGYLLALSGFNLGDFNLSGGPGGTNDFVIEFIGQYAGVNAATITLGVGSLTGGTASITTTVAGGGTGVTEIAERPVERGQIDVFLDSTYGGIGGTQITDPFEESIQLGEKFKPKFIHNTTYQSFKDAIEVAPSFVFSFTQEHNSQSRTHLAAAIASDTIWYLRIRAQGLDLSTAQDDSVLEQVQFDCAGKFTEPEEIRDASGSGVYAYRYNFVGLGDSSGMGRPWQADIVNTITAL